MSNDFRFDVRADRDRAFQLEWLETNGIGGWASSTVSGANTRRYHGLLVAATAPPVGRVVLLSKLDETLRSGNVYFNLGTNLFPGAVHPRGVDLLESFETNPFPTFVFRANGSLLRKTVTAIHGLNTAIVTYELLKSNGEVVLGLRPFVAGRDYHATTHANDAIESRVEGEDGIWKHHPYRDLPPIWFSVPGASYEPSPHWYYRFQLPVEKERGLDSEEDLFTPGRFECRLNEGETLSVIVSTDDPGGLDAPAMVAEERQRRERLVERRTPRSPLVDRLSLAADKFIVRRGEEGSTIIAGYPWFSDWGRDTMIAFEGLCLTTERFADARRILVEFSHHVSQGMLPNRFPDGGETPEYNTVDATLWYFVAIHAFIERTNDDSLAALLLPVLRDIVDWHQRGTRHGIRMDTDGLLTAGGPDTQLTWMDARVDGRAITPRNGKAVEINALWYNALRILAELESRVGHAEGVAHLTWLAERVGDEFRRAFWLEELGYLADVVDGGRTDTTLRPNQLIALSLPYPIVDATIAASVLERVEQSLLTPVGLRTLPPSHPSYAGAYEGGPSRRDAIYHQGTVWPWLLGPYMRAVLRFRPERGRSDVMQLLDRVTEHLDDAGVGTIAEIYDADLPHRPRGCFAQAWSVAEVLAVAASISSNE